MCHYTQTKNEATYSEEFARHIIYNNNCRKISDNSFYKKKLNIYIFCLLPLDENMSSESREETIVPVSM